MHQVKPCHERLHAGVLQLLSHAHCCQSYLPAFSFCHRETDDLFWCAIKPAEHVQYVVLDAAHNV